MTDHNEAAPALAQQSASDADFGTNGAADGAAIDEGVMHSSRVSVLFNASSMFECALAATIKCTKSHAALPNADFSLVVKDLVACNPHVIVILGEWSQEFYDALSKASSASSPPAVTESEPEATTATVAANNFAIIVLRDKVIPHAPSNILYVTPNMFAKIVPCRSEISAYIIFSHLMRGEYPDLFKDGLEEARYFRIALRASIQSSLEAWSFVNNIVTDWHHVMDSDDLVMYGRFIVNVGPRIATKRIKDHSTIIVGLNGIKIRVIECPDFADIARDIALERGDVAACITYSISANTSECLLTCETKNNTAADHAAPGTQSVPIAQSATPSSARDILMHITGGDAAHPSGASIAPIVPITNNDGTLNESNATCATDVVATSIFFAKVASMRV